MTQSTAEKLANLALGAAVVGAAWYVIRTPPLRRAAWRLAVAGLTGTAPAWFRREVEQGWRESGRSRGPSTALRESLSSKREA